MLLAQYFWKGYSFGKKKKKKGKQEKENKKKKKSKKKRKKEKEKKKEKKKNGKKSKKRKEKEKQSLAVPNTVLSNRVFRITIEECLFYRFFCLILHIICCSLNTLSFLGTQIFWVFFRIQNLNPPNLGDLEIRHVFVDSIVFRQQIYCSFQQMVGTSVIFCGRHKSMTPNYRSSPTVVLYKRDVLQNITKSLNSASSSFFIKLQTSA